jgi:hypothetical protein
VCRPLNNVSLDDDGGDLKRLINMAKYRNIAIQQRTLLNLEHLFLLSITLLSLLRGIYTIYNIS